MNSGMVYGRNIIEASVLRDLDIKLAEKLKKFNAHFLENVPIPYKKPSGAFNEYELQRILTECLEVIFTFHNIKKKTFDVMTMVELMDQIIPTACVLGTAFWVFYVNNRARICSCWEYDLKCLHNIDDRAKIWLTDPPVQYFQENFPVVPSYLGVVYPKNVEYISAISNRHIDVMQEFCVCNDTKEKSANYTIVSMISRFNLVPKKRNTDDNRVLVLDPSPVVHPYYGWALPHILLKMYSRYYKRLVVCLSHTPEFTLQRVHSYIQMMPSIKYDIEMPIMFSPNNFPLTHLDFEMVRDICKCLHDHCDVFSDLERISTFLSKAQKEYSLLGGSMFGD